MKRTDARGHSTSYAYDESNRVTKVTSPTKASWTYGYDPAGNLISMTDANGNTTTTAGDGVIEMGYDALNRPTEIDYPGEAHDVTLDYDALSRVTRMTDGFGSESYRCDDVGRLTRVARGVEAFSYRYDGAGNLLSRRYPDGATTRYAYDAGNPLSAATAGMTTTYGYDELHRLTQACFDFSCEDHVRYAYDAVGNRTEKSTPMGTTTYTYDEPTGSCPRRASRAT
ncbi:MAG: hypothetical protein GEU68_09215 [Actinobacteria bacterium]|nr:hypothetical protein [Actinomycetota bacterium]